MLELGLNKLSLECYKFWRLLYGTGVHWSGVTLVGRPANRTVRTNETLVSGLTAICSSSWPGPTVIPSAPFIGVILN